MNPWPHGVIVVPTMPTTASQYAGDDDSCGRRTDWSARAQSGLDAIAEKTYAAETATPMTTNRICTRRYDPSAMNATTTNAALAALIWGGIPKIPSADPMPANSATIDPRLAARSSNA